MIPVPERVAEYARSHPDEKLAIVGHADLGGAAAQNRPLSERRARGVYYCLTQPKGSTAKGDWDALRTSDRWGSREQEAILRDLGYLTGETVGDPDSLRVGLRSFERDRGLPMNGPSGKTWGVLIEAYMCRASMAVRDTQILNMDNPARPRGRKWEGRASEEPVRNLPGAWRPNRRTELIFVKARDLEGDEWLLQPAETGTFVVRGSVHLSNGAPLPNAKFVLTAPDGEYMDGERPSGPQHGQPIPGKTGRDGRFAYPDNAKGPGIYSFRFLDPFHVWLGEKPGAPHGRSVWKRLDAASEFRLIAEPVSGASRRQVTGMEGATC
jgi:hypothetical protein